jgi:hypothetical protein
MHEGPSAIFCKRVHHQAGDGQDEHARTERREYNFAAVVIGQAGIVKQDIAQRAVDKVCMSFLLGCQVNRGGLRKA